MDLVFSDVHANLPALKVLLRHVKRRNFQRFVILGDMVGYGAQPNQVLDCIQKLKHKVIVRGNHDRACAWANEDECFSLPARQSAAWTRTHLSGAHLRFLRELPCGLQWVGEDYQIAHGSPCDEDAYILQPRDALRAFGAFSASLCFFGHSHLPCIFELDEQRRYLDWIELEESRWVPLRKGCRYLINPGSIGQPRDRDPRISFITYDPELRRVKLHRIPYDIGDAADAIRVAGLHPNLAERLFHGV